MPGKLHGIYQIKVTLAGITPPVWRRFLVPDNTSLLKLHDVLQIVMGWTDSHLHMFTVEGVEYGDIGEDGFSEDERSRESKVQLNQLIHREGQRLRYEYDYGDSWVHTLVVEKMEPHMPGVSRPLCLEGARACPPEDVGGPPGYEHMLEAVRDPQHKEHDDYLTWLGGEFDPEAFDLESINTRLAHMGRGQSVQYMGPWAPAGDEWYQPELTLEPAWPDTLTEEERAMAEELPLRRDMVTLLTYVRDRKVTGTDSTGNFPLKAVREISAQFVDPPVTDGILDGLDYHVRSEDEIWPLYLCHVLAASGGLLKGGMARRWELTPRGQDFLSSRPASQVLFLSKVWWTRINWAIASAFYFNDGFMPPHFEQIALQRLLELPAGEAVAFEPFADRMAEEGGIIWSGEDKTYAPSALRHIIERTLVEPLADFGILQTEYEPYFSFGEEFKRLSAFRVTTFGTKILEKIRSTIGPKGR